MPVARFDPQSRLRRVVFSLAAVGCYVLAFFPMYRLNGPGTAALATAPVIALAWLWGLRVGLVVGFLSFPLNTLLFNLAGLEGWNVVFQEGGGPVQVMAVVIGAGIGQLRDLGERLKTEITERKGAEEALRESEERYRNLVQGVDAIVWEADAATLKISFVSRQAEAMRGYPVERWLRDPDFLANLIHPENRNDIMFQCRSAISEGRDHQLEYRVVAADGRVVWLRNIVSVIPDEKGPDRQLRGLMVDITTQKQAEEQLVQNA